GGFDDVVLVDVEAASADRPVAPSEKNIYVDVGGVRARLHDGPLIGATVDWFVNGWAASVSARPGASELILGVARALRLPGGGDPNQVSLPSMPAGYRVID